MMLSDHQPYAMSRSAVAAGRRAATALMRFALRTAAAANRIEHYLEVMDCAYELGRDAGIQAYFLRPDTPPPEPPCTAGTEFNARAPKPERDARAQEHARVAFQEGVYDGWLDAATHCMHSEIEKHLA